MFAAHSSLSFCSTTVTMSKPIDRIVSRVCRGLFGNSLLDAAWHFRNSRILFCRVCPSPNFNCFERSDRMEPNSHTCHIQAHINCISSSYLYECTHHQLTCCYVKVKVHLIHHQRKKSASDSNWALRVLHFEFIGKCSSVPFPPPRTSTRTGIRIGIEGGQLVIILLVPINHQ